MAITLRFQSTGSIPGNGDPISMRGTSLTVGRGSENELVLPDPNRELSKRHCAIEDHNGNVIVVDFSTNGTFLNYGKIALGTTPTPLNNGDILSVGPYEILVEISSEDVSDLIAAPVDEGPISHGLAMNAPSASELLDAPGDGGDFLDDLLGERDAPVGPGGVDRSEPDDDRLLPPLGDDDDFLGAAADPFAGQGIGSSLQNSAAQDNFMNQRVESSGSAIPDDWDDDFLSPNPKPRAPAANIPPAPNTLPPPAPQAPTAPPASTAPTAPPAAAPTAPTAPPAAYAAPSSGGPDSASRAFLAAVGANDVEISDAELPETMTRLGGVMRILVEGIREILMTRTSIKSEFRIEQTMIQVGGNNPLKFSISPEQAIEAIVRPKSKGYLKAADATSQALDDIKAHEVAMVTGMESALKGILKKLDPAVLEKQINADSTLGGILKSRKVRYWEIYESMYTEISDQAENDFHELFAKEFARAYQDQLDRLK